MNGTIIQRSHSMLEYAGPESAWRMPEQWIWTATLIWSAAVLLEQAAVFVIIGSIAMSRGYTFDRSDWVDNFIPTVVALGVLLVLLMAWRKHDAAPSRAIPILCAVSVASALASILIWTWDMLPRVVLGQGPPGISVAWEVELILLRLLPVAWPGLVVLFFWRGYPTRGSAGRLLTWWAMGGLFFSACATTVSFLYTGWTYLLPEFWGNTVLPPWTALFAIIVVVGLVFWLGSPSRRFRIILLIIGVGASFSAGALHAWFDERFTYVRHWTSFSSFIEPGNLADVAAEVFLSLVLCQIAPITLLLFAARVPQRSSGVRVEQVSA